VPVGPFHHWGDAETALHFRDFNRLPNNGTFQYHTGDNDFSRFDVIRRKLLKAGVKMARSHNLVAGAKTIHRGTFDANIPPALAIDSGDTVVVTTLSGSEAELPNDKDGFTVLPEHREALAQVPPGLGPHFMTGPVAVAGAMPGDELVVEILAMELAQDWGWNAMRPGKGTLPEDFPQGRTIQVGIDQKRGLIKMPWGLELKAHPFFGIIGVAPRSEDGPQTSVIPRAFGGNIDNKNLGAGATLHLPVFNPGGLLSVGDGHATQGDGEVCLTAIETALRGTLRVSLKKNSGLARPWAETPSHWITMSFDEDLDRAAQDAVREMVALIVKCSGLSPADTYTLCSVAADVHVTQLVNVKKGAHVMLAKSLTPAR
jgi:acetamidase/formamidase